MQNISHLTKELNLPGKMAAVPCWLVNSTASPATWLLQFLAGAGEEEVEVDWELRTKYYSAMVRLTLLQSDCPVPAGEPEAVVVLADTLQQLEAGWARVRGEPAVRLVVVAEGPGQDMLAWSVERQFELIDLGEESYSTSEDDDGFDEKTGKERIREALEAHTWSNLVLTETDFMWSASATLISPTTVTAVEEEPEDVGESIDSSDEEFGEFVGGEEDFESLFANLTSLKEKAATMSDGERKAFAENVAVSFFSAIGGNKKDL